jgi:hypothetical protein
VILNVTNNPAYIYHWKLNGGDVGSNSNEYKAKAAGTYTLSITNAEGCSNTSTNPVVVVVKNLPILSTVELSGATEFCDDQSLTLSMTATTGYTYRWENANGAIAGATNNSYVVTTSGAYRLAITNQESCLVKSPAVQVKVKPNPVLPVIVTENYQANQCKEEKSIVLKVNQASSEYTYQWKRNGINIPDATQSSIQGFLQAADYTVNVDNNGCKKESASQSIVLQSGPAKPTVIAKGPTVWFLACSNDSATQYKWYYNGQLISEANTYLYIANQKLGTYTVSISMGQGCFASSDPVTIPLGTTGIVETDPFSNLKIYPNPTTGLFSIEMNNNVYGDLNITVFTEEGRKVMNIKFEKTTQYFYSQIDLTGQNKGVFIISLFMSNFNSQRKLILQ